MNDECLVFGTGGADAELPIYVWSTIVCSLNNIWCLYLFVLFRLSTTMQIFGYDVLQSVLSFLY